MGEADDNFEQHWKQHRPNLVWGKNAAKIFYDLGAAFGRSQSVELLPGRPNDLPVPVKDSEGAQ